MDRQAEVIHHKMEQTRSALADKLETLERKVTGTVEDATEVVQAATTAVTDTVESVQDAVQETVETVKESVEQAVGTVKEAFDLRRQVRQHPWLMFGGAVATGFLGERLLQGRGREQFGNTMASLVGATARAAFTNGATESHANEPASRSNGVKKPAAESAPASKEQQHDHAPGLANLLGAELDQLKKLAIGAALGVVRDVVVESMAEEISRPFAQIMDSVTSKLGGQPLPPISPEHEAQEGEETKRETGNGISSQPGAARTPG